MRKFITMGALLSAMLLIPAAVPAQAQSGQPADAQTNGDSQSTSGAQNNNNGAMMAAKTPPTTVTGCIAAGKKDGTYKITADDGTTYMLRSRNTNFADHVGHTVTVTGHVMTGQMNKGGDAAAPSNSGDANQNAPADSGATAKKTGPNHLMVRSMTMVSDSCKAR